MIEYPLFRAFGSLSIIEDLGTEIKEIQLNERGGILRYQSRAIAEQANVESAHLNLPHIYAAVVDKPLPHEENLPFNNVDQLKGIVASKFSEDGIWEKDDTKLISRREVGPYLGVFMGPIDNKSVRACYQTFIGESYPSENEPNPSLDVLAGAALRLIVPAYSNAALKVDQLTQLPNVQMLKQVMNTLKLAYKSFGNASAAWNVLWMLHVDQGLRILQDAVTAYSGKDLDTYISKVLFPSFALPNPTDGVAYRSGHVLATAMKNFWFNSDLALSSIESIHTKRASTISPTLGISALNWEEFDSVIHSRDDGGRDNALLGLIKLASRTPISWELFSDITEEEFFSPISGVPTQLEIFNVDGTQLATHGKINNVEIIESSLVSLPNTKWSLSSAEFIVLLPLVSNPPNLAHVLSSAVSLEDLAPKNQDHLDVAVVKRSLWGDGRIALQVRFERKLKKSAVFKHVPKVRQLKIQLPVDDPLSNVILRNPQLKILMLPPAGVGCLVVESGRKKTIDVLGQDEFDSTGVAITDGDDYGKAVDSNSDLEVVIWSVDTPQQIEVDGKQRVVDANCVIRHLEVLRVNALPITIDVDQVTFIFDPTESNEDPVDSNKSQSPLRAATEKGLVEIVLLNEDSADLRGQIESLIYANWYRWSSEKVNLGHIAVSADRHEGLDDVVVHDETRVLVSSEISGVGGLWPVDIGDHVEETLLNSTQLELFLKAFEKLKLIDAVKEIEAKGGPSWISKVEIPVYLQSVAPEGTSWRMLIDEYLDSYSQLVAYADEVCGNFGKFWARFPFALSIWGESPRRLTGVMISPFHPLRLAWLANAEDALRTSKASVEVRRMFAGTISGWQFPMLTRSNTHNGTLMAIPTDNGSDSLFAGWSMLVYANIDMAEPLVVPRTAANFEVPGVSANGLDASAVESAVTDFCKANPYVSTLVIDLSASSPSPRTRMLDLGLIKKVKSWSVSRLNKGQSSGGVRVYDSINRLGEIPGEVSDLTEIEMVNPPSVTWRKYNPRSFNPGANIRVMNDSGVKVLIQETKNRYGVVAIRPLRRFEVSHVKEGQVASELNPLVSTNEASPYIGALIACESRDCADVSRSSQVRLSIDASHSLLSGADWTVVGESGLAPAALSALLQTVGMGSNRSTLWEWRPPFFDGGNDSSISTVDRRPYMTVAQIPKIYSQKLKGLVGQLLGDQATPDDVDKKIDQILGTLGSRGIGLASLINGNQRYRTHQKGALGFSTTFNLIDSANTAESVRFVIPLDSANQYLNVLAGRSRREGGSRADLLVMEIRENELVLVPIEIKFYSLESPLAILPDLSDVGVLDAINQANATIDLLEDVKRYWEETRGEPGTRELIDNALAALVDAAIRLTPISREVMESIHGRVQKLVSGQLNIEVGKPIVAYLVATSNVKKSRHAQLHAPMKAEVFIADPRTVDADLQSGQQTVALKEWQDVINNAFNAGIHSPTLPVSPSSGGGLKEENQETEQDPSVSIQVENQVVLPEVEASDPEEHLDMPAEISDHLKEEIYDEVSEMEDLEQAVEETLEPVVPNITEMDHVEEVDIPVSSPTLSIVTPGVKIRVGEFFNSDEVAYFWPGNTNLNSLNVGVLGDMGTGKTQLCLGLVNQLRRLSRESQPTSMSGLILDYKSDYQKPAFLAAVGGKVLRPQDLPLDLFGVSGEKTLPKMNAKAMSFIQIISMIFSGVGGQQRGRLREVIINQISQKTHSPTMADIAEAYRLANDNRDDSVTEILNTFVYGEVFTSNPSEFQTIEELLDGNVVVVDLAANGELDERTKKTLVAVFVTKYFEHMKAMPKWGVQSGEPELRRLNSFLLVDEAVSIMEYDFKPLHDILLQGREYGVAVILSSQYLSHFISGGANYAQPLRTWFIHRVPTVSKKSLNDLGIVSATVDDATRIADLGLHEAFYATFDCPGRFIKGFPFYRQIEEIPVEDREW